ncbi:MAG: SpoIIE family protein phosphatase [Alkalispirochaetaceae bacterium]
MSERLFLNEKEGALGKEGTFIEERQLLHRYEQGRINNQTIARIATNFYYCREDEKIFALADKLRENETIMAVGVVDEKDKVVGIIVRKDFFNTMVRPYARDIFRNHPVREIVQQGRVFDADINLFSVSEEISEDMRKPGVTYYLLTNEDGLFRGIFSTQDMLLYLSQITQSDIALARKLQSRIVRERHFVVGRSFEFVASSRTAKGVGGDYYEIRQFQENLWMAALCDVSGKGVAASIITAIIWGMMSMFSFTKGCLAEFVRSLNEYIVQTFESEKFVTGLFIEYDESVGELSVCDMGHSHFFLFRDSKLMRLNTNQQNLPIGVAPDIEAKVDTFRPRRGDTLFMITDGLIEQTDMTGETYSLERIARVLRSNASEPVEILADRLGSDFNSFRGKRSLNDDVTFALMRFEPQEVRL